MHILFSEDERRIKGKEPKGNVNWQRFPILFGLMLAVT